MKHKITLLAGVCLLFAGSTLAERVEEIYGFNLGKEGATFQVLSHGGSQRSEFKVSMDSSMPPQLTLMRLVEDDMPDNVAFVAPLYFKFSEFGLVGGEEFVVKNPFATMTVPVPKQ